MLGDSIFRRGWVLRVQQINRHHQLDPPRTWRHHLIIIFCSINIASITHFANYELIHNGSSSDSLPRQGIGCTSKEKSRWWKSKRMQQWTMHALRDHEGLYIWSDWENAGSVIKFGDMSDRFCEAVYKSILMRNWEIMYLHGLNVEASVEAAGNETGHQKKKLTTCPTVVK